MILDSLLIKNFRLFKELTVNRLGQVNLFVGKNNSGKSSLLEAIYLFSIRTTNIAEALVANRDESLGKRLTSEKTLKQAFENPLRFLFYGYHFPTFLSDGIEIGQIKDESKRIHILINAYLLTKDEKGTLIKTPLNNDQLFISTGTVEIVLELWENEKKFLFVTIAMIGQPQYGYGGSFLVRIPDDFVYNVQNVSVKNANYNKLASLWDNIDLTDSEETVISCLQLIDQRVEGLSFVGDSDSYDEKRRIPIIRCKGVKERIPLKNMGDGMLRLFHIILAMVNAKDGFLLIDEFENGLHWRIQSELWEMIFTLSEKLNVQVFATTHSKDCARSFQEVWANKQELGSFHRLQPDSESGIKAVSYTCEMLGDALETDVEFR